MLIAIMNFPFYIAKRYLFSKKSTHAINIISGISVIGVAVAAMALVVTLSVFNGFHDLVASFFTNMDPQLKVMPVKGKTASATDPILTEIRQLPEVEVATECLEDQALAVYGNRQMMVKLKGVQDNFDSLTHIREVLEGDGEFALHAADMHYGIPGLGIAYQLALVQRVFFITAAMFGGLAVFGTVTKSDLSQIGSICGMALWGLIVAVFVNMFFHSSRFDWIVSFAGVLIFSGLTMWDAQKIKLIAQQEGAMDAATRHKVGLMGALELYLDFINLFIYLLRILGRSRD